MTPKEKAQELVDKFIQTNGNSFFAKECAFIVVYELINYSQEWDDSDYWEQVNKEIIKL